MFGDSKIRELSRHQVWDAAKGCFFVGLTVAKEGERILRYRGRIVYEDRFGQRITIRGTNRDLTPNPSRA